MLGFGFNKAKVLASAEKSVKQGKLPNAIADYEKIAKEDPSDLNVLNTIGDLYVRSGNLDKATAYFKQVGDAYASDGFTVKAIAMFKKLSKHNPSHTESILKLAELYTLQGLNNDARVQYTLLAEHFLHAGDHDGAAGMFQKILELDPENTQIQGRLAEIYAQLGKAAEARDLYFRAAQALRARGALEASDHALGQVLGLDGNFSQALMLRGQVRLERGDAQGAAEYLEAIPDLDSRPEALRLLLSAQLKAGKRAEAEPFARKLLAIFGDVSGITLYAEALMAAGDFKAALDFYREHAAKLFAADTPAILADLHKMIGPLKEDSRALQTLQDLFAMSGSSSHSAEVTELLAHAWVKDGELAKARDLYRKLAESEPENPTHAQNYRQVVSRLGGDSSLASLKDGTGKPAAWPEDWEETEPEIEQQYPPEVAAEIKNAITDSELFSAYNLLARAVPFLEAVLPRAPRDIKLNQRLLGLYTRLGKLADAAQRCQVLSSVYAEANLPDQAHQYAEQATRYREQSQPAPFSEAPEPPPSEAPAANPPAPSEVAENQDQQEEPASADASEGVSSAEAPGGLAAESGEGGHEIDLSEEWERVLTADHSPEASAASFTSEAPPSSPAAMSAEVGDLVEEIRFYLSQEMGSEAQAALARAEAISPGVPVLAELRAQVAAAAPVPADLQLEIVNPADAPGPAPDRLLHVPETPALGSGAVSTPGSEGNVVFSGPSLSTRPSGPEVTAGGKEVSGAAAGTLGSGQARTEPVPSAPTEETAARLTLSDSGPSKVTASAAEPAGQPGEKRGPEGDDLLGGLVLDLEESLGGDFAFGTPAVEAPASSRAPATVPASPPPKAAETVGPVIPPWTKPTDGAVPPAPEQSADETAGLAGVFAEFKRDVEATSGENEDPEVHYNLGMAFKEMGLMDEAIGELQKVCKAIEQGHTFPQVIQAYTWLAHCFIEKGIPEAGTHWYERALELAGLSDEHALAIRYELACAQQAAGDVASARRHFMRVLSINIDYRDVAMRIKALKP
jgi:tetratricopeptide (TPR) repeat protein